jgi:pSer/pThr/pTyr-binding forkhead associated (FHA) protein
MAKLILSMDGLTLKEIPLNKERMSIGRKPHNDIQIDNLAISGEHAVVVTILNDAFLEDLNSTNGTFVNGRSVKKHFLQNQDVIELGKYRLKFIAEATQGPTAQADFEKTMILRPDVMRKTAEQLANKDFGDTQVQVGLTTVPSLNDLSPPKSAMIQILTGNNSGRELELTKTLTTLGKPGVQVAVIARRPQGYFITHVEGDQFPIVNGRAIDAQACQISDHDIIDIAGIKMEFFFKE